ncbi:MAG: hypothetical protein ACJ77M_03005 [Thermoleophilaceae bacterium]|jgi:Mg2+/Co2+ transporter CorC
MGVQHDWLQVSLDSNTRRGLAERIEATAPPESEQRPHLVKVLRSSRDELLLDHAQGELVLTAIETTGQLSTLQARLEAFLGRR